MSLPKCLDFSNYNRYPSDENPTTDDDIQTFLENQNQLMQVLEVGFGSRKHSW